MVCIAAVVAAVVFHVTLIMFKTGSMEPTIPTGSLAVVHQIPASEIEVGDVVTVDRAGELPVTHRVTSVSGSGATRTITMRGDANPTDDSAPYVVSTVRIVWLSFPGWANIVVLFSNPVVLGALTLGATTLVTWAFWPRDERHGRRRVRPGRARNLRRDRGRAARSIGTTGATLAVALAVVAVSAPTAARAAEVETVIRGTYLTLTSISDPVLMSSMTTGAPVSWQVGIDAAPPEPGIVRLGVAGVAPLPDAGDFSLSVQACAVRWVAGACTSGAESWVTATDLRSAVSPTTAFGAREVGAMEATDQRWLMITVVMTTASQPQPAQLRIWAWGVGSPLSTGSLAATGSEASAFVPPALLAGLAIGGGLLLTLLVRRRRGNVDDVADIA